MKSDAGGGAAPRSVALLFKALSRLRDRRIFHPFGVVLRGKLTPVGEPSGAAAFDREAVVVGRLSRALGLPEQLPDIWGLALRVPDALGPGRHQDLLLASAGSAPLLRHTLLPARGCLDLPYSSIAPYRLRGDLVVIAARAAGGNRPGPDLAGLATGSPPALDFVIAVAQPAGTWRPVARVSLRDRLEAGESEHLAFDPTNTGGGLHLAGLVNLLRGPSYRASQEGRGLRSVPLAARKAPERDQAEQDQDHADPPAPEDQDDDADDHDDAAER